MRLAERWWSSTTGPLAWDAVERVLLSPGTDPYLDASQAFLAHHRLGERVLCAVADRPMLTGRDVQAAAVAADLTGVSKGTDAGVSERRVWETLVRKGVPPQVAARRTGMVFGVPSSHLASWMELAGRPGVREEAVIAKADAAVMERARAVSEWVETDHPRDEKGQFATTDTRTQAKADADAARKARVGRLMRVAAVRAAAARAAQTQTATATTVVRAESGAKAKADTKARATVSVALVGAPRHGGIPTVPVHEDEFVPVTKGDPYHEQLAKMEFEGHTATALTPEAGVKLWSFMKGYGSDVVVSQKWLNDNAQEDAQHASEDPSGYSGDILDLTYIERGYIEATTSAITDAVIELPESDQEVVHSYNTAEMAELMGRQFPLESEDVLEYRANLLAIAEADAARRFPGERIQVVDSFAGGRSDQVFRVVRLQEDIPTVFVAQTTHASGRRVSEGSAATGGFSDAHTLPLAGADGMYLGEVEVSDNGAFIPSQLRVTERTMDVGTIGLSLHEEARMRETGVHAVHVVTFNMVRAHQGIEFGKATATPTVTWVETDHPRNAIGQFAEVAETGTERAARLKADRVKRLQRVGAARARAAATRTATAGTGVKAEAGVQAQAATRAAVSVRALVDSSPLPAPAGTSVPQMTPQQQAVAVARATANVKMWAQTAILPKAKEGWMHEVDMQSPDENSDWSFTADEVIEGTDAFDDYAPEPTLEEVRRRLGTRTSTEATTLSKLHSVMGAKNTQVRNWLTSEQAVKHQVLEPVSREEMRRRNIGAAKTLLHMEDAPDDMIEQIVADAGYADIAEEIWLQDMEQEMLAPSSANPILVADLESGAEFHERAMPWANVPFRAVVVAYDPRLAGAGSTTPVRVTRTHTTTQEYLGGSIRYSALGRPAGRLNMPVAVYKVTPTGAIHKRGARMLRTRLYDHGIPRRSGWLIQ